MKNILQDITDKKHDTKVCRHNWKENGKFFNLVPNTCQYFEGSSNYQHLIVKQTLDYEKSEIPDGVEGDQQKQSVAAFRIKLAIFEDLKDEILVSCRLQEDEIKPKAELQNL